LSREDGDGTESESIATQKHLLEAFCARDTSLSVAGIYIDDGYTGTNCDRPDFQRLISDVDKGRIDCVVVKDLSRFGRDYIDLGYYLERFFPVRGVRFIAVNDNIDSARGAYDVMLPLKNVFNAMYAKDTSEKVRKAFRAKQQRGEFVSGFPPYGYRKDPENKNRFVIDPEAAETVKRIFERKADGSSNREIARLLDREGIAAPIAYKRSRGERLSVGQRYRGTCGWSDSAVRRILTNETYLGRMVSNRSPTDGVHGRQRAAPRSEWIVVEGTHEPIVTDELWERAHRAAAAQRAAAPARESLFRGVLRCGDCGCAMVRKGGAGSLYLCSANKAYGARACQRHAVSEEVLTRAVLSDLNRLIAGVSGLDKLAERSAPPRTGAPRVPAAAADRARRQKRALYEDYCAGRVTRDAYIRRREEYDRQETERGEAENTPRERTAWRDALLTAGGLDRLDRATLERTVREIRVFSDRRLEICYLFSEEALQ